jgi:uncharacterized protein (TIGR00369 family)
VSLTSRDCVICGRENPVGLRLAYAAAAGTAEARWTVDPRYCGVPGVLHGGLVLALLDDAMWYAAYSLGAFTLTAEASVRYRAPVRAGRTVVARGRVVDHRGRLWRLAAELVDAADGAVLAAASGKFLEVPPADVGLGGGGGAGPGPVADPGGPAAPGGPGGALGADLLG